MLHAPTLLPLLLPRLPLLRCPDVLKRYKREDMRSKEHVCAEMSVEERGQGQLYAGADASGGRGVGCRVWGRGDQKMSLRDKERE